MRSSKSRSRSKSNRNRSMGNIVNRVFDSSGPEGKVRGTPQQIIDKYGQLARDALLSNDRVATENFQQHAEHYARLLGEAQREAEARREQQDQQNRERQREREEGRAAQENGDVAGQDYAKNGAMNAPAPSAVAAGPVPEVQDPEAAPQPDVLDLRAEADAGGLVETPENQEPPLVEDAKSEAKPRPARKPRSRNRAKKTEETPPPETAASDMADAAAAPESATSETAPAPPDEGTTPAAAE